MHPWNQSHVAKVPSPTGKHHYITFWCAKDQGFTYLQVFVVLILVTVAMFGWWAGRR